MKKERQPGFYWVLINFSGENEWIISKWCDLGKYFSLFDYPDPFKDKDFLEIIETPIPPPSK